jgi:hypothetical protein
MPEPALLQQEQQRPAPDMLFVVGLQLGDKKDITFKGLEGRAWGRSRRSTRLYDMGTLSTLGRQRRLRERGKLDDVNQVMTTPRYRDRLSSVSFMSCSPGS